MISERSITNSIAALGFRLHEQIDRKRREGDGSRLAETDQQVQVEISGEAGQLEWTTYEVHFDQTIYVAPAQRMNPTIEPHFTFGSTMQSDPPVMLTATVQSWIKDSSGNFIGAKVSIGAVTAQTNRLTKFRARMHLTFQGFSSPEYPATDAGEG